MMRFTLGFLMAALLVGCASNEVEPLPETNNSIRPEDPDPNGPGATDAGNADVDVVDTPDLAGCPPEACAEGMIRCEGAGVMRCVADTENPGCGLWELEDCDGPGEVCSDGECIVPTSCVDNDGDGYGAQCAQGPDCDDGDDATHPGANEVCDSVDNNCDGDTDEGYDIGMPCTIGSGACMGDGVMACGIDGTAVCRAQQMGEPEVCDGVDNDCDGVVDNGVCVACQSDPFEPNDAAADAELLKVNEPKYGFLCPGDNDYFKLLTANNTDYIVYVTFPESVSDVLVNGYMDGNIVAVGDTAGTDTEAFAVAGDMSTEYHIELVERDNVETLFRAVLVDSIQCAEEDGFTPNHTLESSAQLPPFWITQAFLCPMNGPTGGSDYYFLGERTQGDVMDLFAEGLDSFGTDIDVYLWADPQGDGTFEVIDESSGFGDYEQITATAPHDGAYVFEVFDYDGYGGNYDVGWTLN